MRICFRSSLFSCIFLFLAVNPAGISAERFPELLIGPDEPMPLDVPNGTFVRSAEDFILCADSDFKIPGPAGSRWNAETDGRSYSNVARFNNETISEFLNSEQNKKSALSALARMEAGLASDPQFFSFLYNAGRFAYLAGDYKKSIDYYDRARGLMPRSPSISLNLARVFSELKQNRTVIAYGKAAMLSDPVGMEPVMFLANYHMDRGSPSHARIFIDDAFRRWPDHINTKILKARLLALEGRKLQAIHMLESLEVREIDGTFRTGYDISYHKILADLYFEKKAYDQCRDQLDALLSRPQKLVLLKTTVSEIKRYRDRAAKLAR